jgi:glycine dehydrogenase
LLAREQHIRREKATSNICTSQALLANMAAMYAVYHGPQGLSRIADKVHGFTQVFVNTITGFGYGLTNNTFFDTVTIDVTPVLANAELLHKRSMDTGINLRRVDDGHVGVTFDESVTPGNLVSLINVFAISASASPVSLADLAEPKQSSIPESLKRISPFLPHPVFNKHHSETEMLRYISHLASKDLSLAHAMIPLGSCTMKLNSTSSMIPLSWPQYGNIHPFAPYDQVQGYHTVIKVKHLSLKKRLTLTQYSRNLKSISAKSLAFMQRHFSQTLEQLENTPASASSEHIMNRAGRVIVMSVLFLSARTEPTLLYVVSFFVSSCSYAVVQSAAMAGLKVVAVKVHSDGNLDLEDLRMKAEKNRDNLAAFMVSRLSYSTTYISLTTEQITYPSTFGVFEAGVDEAGIFSKEDEKHED